MDRYSPRLIRGVAAASVSIFLVAGAAFAANAVMGPPSVGPDFAPVAAASSPLGASKVADPTETPRAAETAEPRETPDVQDESGDDNAGDRATSTSGETPEQSETPEPSETHDGGGHDARGDDGSSHDQGGSDQGSNG